jgi:hypothetical protein
MTASNAICARAFANSMKVSAPFALCAPGKTTYGRSSGFCIDPVEKKALNHFLRSNLGCKFCQNWDISKAQEFDVLAECASPEDIARTAEQLGCPSVAYTYNDPTIFMNTLWTRRSPAMNAVSRASR